MQEIKDYASLVDAVYKIVRATPENREQIDISSIAQSLSIPSDSKAFVSGIAEAMEELVSLGYCKGNEELAGYYHSISCSPDAPNILPSEHMKPSSIDRLLTFLRKRALEFIHRKTVCREYGITFYDQNISIAVKDALDELLPDKFDKGAAVSKLFASIEGLRNSGLLIGAPFVNNYGLRPPALLSNEIEIYRVKGDIFPPEVYFKDPHFFTKIITTGELRLRITLRGAICLRGA